jgi:hypothetical protein
VSRGNVLEKDYQVPQTKEKSIIALSIFVAFRDRMCKVDDFELHQWSFRVSYRRRLIAFVNEKER